MEYIERKRLLFFGLPWTFTKYTIRDEMITINTGLLSTKENDCYMYKVQDVELSASLGERIFGMGTIICYTGDTTNPKLYIEHVRKRKGDQGFYFGSVGGSTDETQDDEYPEYRCRRGSGR